ncbi:MAG: SBBP repeat-containing protein [Flavobacteriales bacterium]|nr:SBBP repeat-containing protein [Flavobacteriales bacterium]
MRIIAFLFALFASTLHAQQWDWAASAGEGSNVDFCNGIATDSQGNVYWVGSLAGTVDLGCGTISDGSSDVMGFIAKRGPDGTCLWVRAITVGFNDAWAYGVAIDADDRIYVTGSYNGNATFGGGVTLNSLGSDDIFLARYDTAGTCLWARRAGNSGSSDEGRGVAVSADGGVFVAGFSGGATIAFDAISIPNPGNYRQLVIARYDSTGVVQWARASAGNGQGKSCRAISVAGDRLFVTGQIGFSAASFDGLALTPGATGAYLYALATDLDGNGVWARSYGNGDHEGMGISADTLGNVFVAARLWGSLFLPDDTLVSANSNDDILVMKLDREGDLHWAKSTGSTQRDLAWDVEADGQGNVYVAMQFQGTIDLFGAPVSALGSEDALIVKLQEDGSRVWWSRPSGFQRDIPLCVHRQAEAPHALYFGGYYWGVITYGGTTIDDVLNGDAMLVSGIDTTFDVSLVATPTCPGACDGAVTAHVNGRAPFTYQWNTGSTSADQQGLCPGPYVVEVMDSLGQVIINTVLIEEAADPGYLVQVLNDSLWIGGGTAWHWFVDGQLLSGADSASVIAPLTGNYHAEVADANGCTWSSDTVLVVLNVGIGGQEAVGVLLHPNPVKDRLVVHAGSTVVQAIAMDASGRSVPLPVLVGNVLDTRSLAAGAWALRITLADGRSLGARFVRE